MWIASEIGFFSITNKADSSEPLAREAGLLEWLSSRLSRLAARRVFGTPVPFWHVRARVMEDLENLCTESGIDPAAISESSSADYRYRLVVGIRGYSKVMAALYRSVDYPNFKSHIDSLPDQREKHDAYANLWEDLGMLQPGGPYGWYSAGRVRRPCEKPILDPWDEPDEGFWEDIMGREDSGPLDGAPFGSAADPDPLGDEETGRGPSGGESHGGGVGRGRPGGGRGLFHDRGPSI